MSVIKSLHEISTDGNLAFVEKVAHLLKMGSEVLGLETAIVSYITGNTYKVMYAVSPDEKIKPNSSYLLADTYCKDTIEADNIVSYHDVAVFPGSEHPCYEKYDLRSYVAAPIRVNNQLYGTLNFSSTCPREAAFSNLDYDYLLLLADWIGSHITKQQSFDEMVQQKAKLEAQNLMLTQITELAGVGTWEYDFLNDSLEWSDMLKGIVHIDVNEKMSAERVLGLIKKEATKKQYQEKFTEIIATGEDCTYELEVLTDAGETRWLETRAHPVMKNGKCIKVIGATRDITERMFTLQSLQEKTELAEKSLEARSGFLANMSHEIRTPIHGVQGMLETLANTPLTSKQKQYLDIAVRSADSLLGIVNDVLDFSKIDSGHMGFEEATVSLDEIIELQVPMFTRLANKKGLALNINTKALKNTMFVADGLRLSQIIINLLTNAIKFTPNGSVALTTRCTEYGAGRFRVKIIVTDTGIGISQPQQEVIFTPFHQAEESTQRRFGGTGLGLAIVKKIVSHYGGNVEVASEIGKGAKFVVTLILNSADEIRRENALGVRANSSRKISREALEKARVLVVEDNEINQIVIKEQLKEIGVNVDLADNGERGVAKVKASIAEQRPYDLVFMDCHMPILDGLQATKCIRELGGQGEAMTIVALTANALNGEKEKCLQAGMNDFISKPVGTSRLHKCLQYHLALSEHALKTSA
ncbi:response regulator [Alteromonas sp. 345S023]|uniref:histidine kinase n=1 Tax=Alteromonas profundi TaxID=2696062 RepID=A0A7X5LLV4_9ALTE|nr:ATP-binding protein [Alteromonas profundi]NDV91738.1 response regulator [Alteromonas profundi]